MYINVKEEDNSAIILSSAMLRDSSDFFRQPFAFKSLSQKHAKMYIDRKQF